MFKTILLSCAATALCLHAAQGLAAQAVNGEGATSVITTYNAEFALDAKVDTAFQFTAYPTTSAKGLAAFINNAGTAGSGVPSGQTVDFAVSDAALTSGGIVSYTEANFGPDGAIIQIPVLGAAVAIPFTDPGVTSNGGLRLTDNDLCGIFSGKLTSYKQLTLPPSGGANGTFQVVYRADAAGTTFLLTQHLKYVCTSSNSNFTSADLASMPTSSFTALSTTAKLPNAIAATGIGGEATAVQNASSAIGWVSPEHTSIVAQPAAGYGTLLVASLRSPNGTFYLPNYVNASVALSGAQKNASNLSAPATNAAATNQLNWLPLLPQPQTGYPIVGYNAWFLATCYSNGKAAAIVSFLTRHYQANGPYKNAITNTGYLPVTNASYVTAINKYILGNSQGANINLGNATACQGRAGR